MNEQNEKESWNSEHITKQILDYTEKNKILLEGVFEQQKLLLNDLSMSPIIQGWYHFTTKALKNPDKIFQSQMGYWQNYLSLCHQLTDNLQNQVSKSDEKNSFLRDRRFQHEHWENNYLFNFVKESYLLMAEHLKALVEDIIEDPEDNASKKLRFYIQQFIDAIAPSNFIATNPEVLEATLTSKGENLINGFKEFFQHFPKKNFINAKMTDSHFFELGKNIAATPGKVIYQNEIMQLIQYAPLTPKVSQFPLLIIPPWINKYYILDLCPENSFVKWLLEQGLTVFLISWVNADERHATKEFSDYLTEGPLCALRIIEQITQEQKINVMGYCIGGTLLACLLAYLDAQGNSPINSATFLTTLLDFSAPGDLGVFIDEEQVSFLEKQMASKGYLDGNVLMSTFNLLRANDLIWKNFVNNYLKGEKPIPFDLLYWNSDPSNIPEKVHSFYLRQMYLQNLLIQPNAVKLGQVALDLSKISIPSYFLAAQDDHIVPWTSCYRGLQFIGGSKKFVLTDSGHVAGVINAPLKQKYGFRIHDQLHEQPADWFNQATHQNGSWWSDWFDWININNFTGKKVPARIINDEKLKIIEDAPGSYARLRLNPLE